MLSISVALGGCATKEYYYGYSFPIHDRQYLHIHKTTIGEVRQLMGSPTTESNFGNKVYYYVSQQQTRVAFLAPKVEQQRVLALTFDSKGVLSEIKDYTLNDALYVQFDEGDTRLKGSETHPLEQIMGNIGKFNAASSKPGAGN